MQRTNRARGRTKGKPLASLLAVAALLLVSLVLATGAIAQSPPIISTQAGELPTTGGLRPGPVGVAPAVSVQTGSVPKTIRIPKALVDAQVEVVQIVNGVMQDPTGPWVVSWYKETAELGQTGNVVMAGHVDYWNVGPSVFYHVGDLVAGDEVDITGANGQVYKYAVDWNKLINADANPQVIQDVVGPTSGQNLTLITCGGTFDYDTGHYLQRRVIRAHRIFG